MLPRGLQRELQRVLQREPKRVLQREYQRALPRVLLRRLKKDAGSQHAKMVLQSSKLRLETDGKTFKSVSIKTLFTET